MLIKILNAHARWWPCACLKSVSRSRRIEKTLNFLRYRHVIDMVLKNGSDIIEIYWLQLLFLLPCDDGYSCLRCWNYLFSWVSGFGLNFSRIPLWGERLQLDSKSDLTTTGLFLDYFVGLDFVCWTSYLHGINGIKFACIAQLIFCFDEIRFFRQSVRVVFWSVLLKCLLLLVKGFCIIDYQALAMQCIFTLCLCVSFILCVFLEVLVKLFDYFWKPFSPFSKFSVNCLLRFHFVYFNNCAFKDVDRAGWCNCSLAALRVPEMCCWPAKTRKKFELPEIRTCHWPGAQIWFRHNWKRLVAASLLLKSSIGIVASVNGLSFFSCVSGFRLKFSSKALWRKRVQLDS